MNTSPRRLTNLRPLHSRLVEQEEQRSDLGFGTKITDPKSRLVNQDGSFNLTRANGSLWDRLNIYNRLIMMSWAQFFVWVLVAYLVVNTFFAGIYMLAGSDTLSGIDDKNLNGPFWKCFFFSSQTLTTVGYGHISPNNFLTSSIAAFESMIGLLAFALATGLLYGRFSRPVAHVRFSRHSVFAPYLDINAWMFRIVNGRENQLVNLEITVSITRLEAKDDGTLTRKYYPLTLERSKVAFFPRNWTLVHPITEGSPLNGCTPEDLRKSDTEFLISFHALDDTFVQSVHTRSSYHYDEVRWGHKFVSMIDPNNPNILDLDRLDETEEVELN